jgi:hypothetical protein
MPTNEHDNDKCGKSRTDRIGRQAQDAGAAAAQRALAAHWRGQAARKRVAELRAWSGRSPLPLREATNRAVSAATALRAARERASEAYERAATAHEHAANAHDRAADAAEREGDMTRAIEHQRAATRDRTAASDDRSRSQQTTGSVYDAGN